MPSSALSDWQGPCADRIDELLSAHRRLGGAQPGRRVGLEQLNWAAVVRIAAEWQDYCRKLHLEAADYWVETVSEGFPVALADALREQLTKGLNFDHGSADLKAIRKDFGKLGLDVETDLRSRSSHNTGRLDRLGELFNARHAIAHNDPVKIVNVTPIRKHDVKRWRNAADHLAREMDACVATGLARLLGTGRPW